MHSQQSTKSDNLSVKDRLMSTYNKKKLYLTVSEFLIDNYDPKYIVDIMAQLPAYIDRYVIEVYNTHAPKSFNDLNDQVLLLVTTEIAKIIGNVPKITKNTNSNSDFYLRSPKTRSDEIRAKRKELLGKQGTKDFFFLFGSMVTFCIVQYIFKE